MSTRLITASAAALLLALATPGFAQSYTLNGADVPQENVAAIQAHCDALAAADTAAAGEASQDGSGAAAEAGADVGGAPDAAADAGATTPDSSADSSDATTAHAEVDFANLDLQTIDLAACRAGGFIAADGAGAETDAGAGSTQPAN